MEVQQARQDISGDHTSPSVGVTGAWGNKANHRAKLAQLQGDLQVGGILLTLCCSHTGRGVGRAPEGSPALKALPFGKGPTIFLPTRDSAPRFQGSREQSEECDEGPFSY